MSEIVIRINGNIINQTKQHNIQIENEFNYVLKKSKLKRIAITMFIASCSLYSKIAFAASNTTIQKFTIWQSLQPVYDIFADLAMSIGSLGIIIGLVTAIFNKRLGIKVALTTTWAILGCFLVPSGVTLVAIVGHLINDTLIDAFNHIHLAR